MEPERLPSEPEPAVRVPARVPSAPESAEAGLPPEDYRELLSLVRSGQAELLRLVEGIGQKQVAWQLGVAQSTFGKHERERRVPKDEAFARLWLAFLRQLRERHGVITIARVAVAGKGRRQRDDYHH